MQIKQINETNFEKFQGADTQFVFNKLLHLKVKIKQPSRSISRDGVLALEYVWEHKWMELAKRYRPKVTDLSWCISLAKTHALFALIMHPFERRQSVEAIFNHYQAFLQTKQDSVEPIIKTMSLRYFIYTVKRIKRHGIEKILYNKYLLKNQVIYENQ